MVGRPGVVPLPPTRPHRSPLFLFVSLRLDPARFAHSADTVLTPSETPLLSGKSFLFPSKQGHFETGTRKSARKAKEISGIRMGNSETDSETPPMPPFS